MSRNLTAAAVAAVALAPLTGLVTAAAPATAAPQATIATLDWYHGTYLNKNKFSAPKTVHAARNNPFEVVGCTAARGHKVILVGSFSKGGTDKTINCVTERGSRRFYAKTVKVS